ncbi:unnamed protein product [Clonostachys chloroleuca]|uniref:Uncharacterized protein n=1 Tax=Clonostachys chloroleuca TaxID=1926264 RepID=A0AA35PWJ5_9HYPO|nr:unnamed protein product [Clonostachys chloroleuca]
MRHNPTVNTSKSKHVIRQPSFKDRIIKKKKKHTESEPERANSIDTAIDELAHRVTRMNSVDSVSPPISNHSSLKNDYTFNTAPPTKLMRQDAPPLSLQCYQQYSPQTPRRPSTSNSREHNAPWPLTEYPRASLDTPAISPLQRTPSDGRNRSQSVSTASTHASVHRKRSSVAPMDANPFPAPARPLPPVPPNFLPTSRRRESPIDIDVSSPSSGRSSRVGGSGRSSHVEYTSQSPQQYYTSQSPQQSTMPPPSRKTPRRPPRPNTGLEVGFNVMYRKQLLLDKKRKGEEVNLIDISSSGATIAVKEGKKAIRFWDVIRDDVLSVIKISSYIEAGTRSREYLVRSHVVISDSARLAAVSSRFGRTLEIWNWEERKKLQTIDDTDRWVTGRFETFDGWWTPLAAYRGEDNVIDLYAATKHKKPFAKVRNIDLCKAGLPFIPQYPELAVSPTSPLLIAASGPRTARAGRPPPKRESIIVAWDISDYREVSNQPIGTVDPWLYPELEMAIPCALETFESLVVSIWIPPSQRAYKQSVPGSQELEWKLAPIDVPTRYVFVWDLSKGSTNLYGIPNTTSCISPNCRFVAYSTTSRNGRNQVTILDASTGHEMWSMDGIRRWGGEDDEADAFGKVTSLAFSSDGKMLVISDANGSTFIFDVLERVVGL